MSTPMRVGLVGWRGMVGSVLIDRMRAEGAGQEAKGKTQKAVGKAKDTVKGAVDRL